MRERKGQNGVLVLSRREGESVRIGSDITITVTEIDRGRVRLTFTCPREIGIYRTELLDGETAKQETEKTKC